MKADLVSRRNGKYFLTAFGKIVYDAQIIIEKAVVHHCKLKLVDALKSDQMPKEEYNMIIYDLIDNERFTEELIIKNRTIRPLTDQGIKEGAKRNHNEHQRHIHSNDSTYIRLHYTVNKNSKCAIVIQ